MEVLSDNGDELFVVGVPDDGPVTINTFGKDVAASLIEAAIQVARSRWAVLAHITVRQTPRRTPTKQVTGSYPTVPGGISELNE